MPKLDFIIKAGDELPQKLHEFLDNYFSEKDFEKLSKFGGRIQISLTAPFTDRKEQDNKIIINEEFINKIITDPSKSSEKLKTLTRKQLVEIATFLKFPINTKATTNEIKKAIVDHLNSADKWTKISGA